MPKTKYHYRWTHYLLVSKWKAYGWETVDGQPEPFGFRLMRKVARVDHHRAWSEIAQGIAESYKMGFEITRELYAETD